MKISTLEQLQKAKEKAVRFVRDVLDDPDRADEIEDESPEDYAERRHITIKNSKGAKLMQVPTRSELLERIEELKEENKHLRNPRKNKKPKGAESMAALTKRELLERIEELEEENENLQSQLDEIAEIAAPEEEEEEGEE